VTRISAETLYWQRIRSNNKQVKNNDKVAIRKIPLIYSRNDLLFESLEIEPGRSSKKENAPIKNY